MAKEIRIGICGCTQEYLGELAGITIGSVLPQDPLFVREVTIDEYDQRGSLRTTRAHFFLDVHEGAVSRQTEVALSFIQLVSNRRGKDYLYIGGMNRKYKRLWRGPKIPSSFEILEAVCILLRELPREKFEQWLTTMTPKDWVLMR